MGFTRRFVLLGALGSFLSACASKFRTYTGPEVTKIQVTKGDRRMHLFAGDTVLKSYQRVGIGFRIRTRTAAFTFR